MAQPANLQCRKHPKLLLSSDGTCELRKAQPAKYPDCAACPGPRPLDPQPGPAAAPEAAKPASAPPLRDGLAGAPAEPCLICGKVTAFPRAYLRVHLDAQPTGLGTPHLLAGERWPLCSRECQAQAEDPKLTGDVIAAAADALGAL